jgi:hypothetical protein
MRIGVDFDNTIAGYDAVFGRLAAERGLVLDGPFAGKRAVRDSLRQRAGGETLWQGLQAKAYGERMIEAELMPGVTHFFSACRRRGVSLFIVSHKTRYAARGDEPVDLRDAAHAWMEVRGFFDTGGFDIAPHHVFFEETRRDKLGRIDDLGVSYFIDDLEEVFAEPTFPAGVTAILYAPDRAGEKAEQGCGARYLRFSDWHQITEHVLGVPA